MTGCEQLPPSKPESEFTPAEARGQQVFGAYCARCHYPTRSEGMKGPGLLGLTRKKAMPSGAPPSDARIRATILHGRGMMPPAPVGDAELQDLLAYLHTL